MNKLFALLLLLIAGLSVSAQQIISVSPNTISPGATANVVISTTGTFMSSGNVKVDFGPGITVNTVTVTNPQAVMVNITASIGAATGMRTIKLTVNTDELEYTMFDVESAGSGVIVNMNVIPVQKVYLTDFDPNNPTASPLLFVITINNDGVQRNISAKLTVSGDKLGTIVNATKNAQTALPNTVITFNNKEFDSYKLITSNKQALEEATKTGKLPADLYTYLLEVYDGNTKIGETVGRNVVDDPVARPELISPGNDISRQPEIIFTRLPFFQWFSQVPKHTISVYEVKPGQKTREEITLNGPTWTAENVTTKNIVYPTSAELLVEGKTYAWQVVGIVAGSNGEEKLYSDLYWFTINTKDIKEIVYSQFDVAPASTVLKTGEQMQFKVNALDNNNKMYDLTDKVEWRVIPANAGTITPQGFFTAGKFATRVAVVAKYGTQESFSDVDIEFSLAASNAGWDMDAFLRKLFGLDK